MVLLWGTRAFNSLDGVWASLPGDDRVRAELAMMGIWDDWLSVEAARKRWVCFQGVDFGWAPEKFWPGMRRDLLRFEDKLACH